MSQTIAGAPRSSWTEDWDPAPPHPRPAATARTVAACAPSSADEIAREAARAAPAAPHRPPWRALATGVLLAAGSIVTAAVAVLLAGFLFLAASGRESLRLGHGTPAEFLLAAGFGLAGAAALLVLARTRPLTLAPAALLPAAAWLSGHPVPALLAATFLTGVAIALDRARPANPRPTLRTAAFLAAAATACLAASLTGAQTSARTAPQSAPRRAAAATPQATTTPSPASTAPAASTPAPTAPAAPLAPLAARSPAALVAAYYAALDAHRFADAWAVLAPTVRRAFGGFAHWRAGYATTLSSRPRQLRLTASGPATWDVRHLLVARDRTACGAPLERRFAVRWRVARASGGWSVTALGATSLTRARACS